MVSSFHHEKKSIVISEVHTVARAEFIQVTLAAHGITASLTPSSDIPLRRLRRGSRHSRSAGRRGPGPTDPRKSGVGR